MEHSSTAQRDHSTTREQIMNTAYGLFMQQGYENTSIQSIIRAVGIAKGTFYHHFSSKDELLNEITLSQSRAAVDRVRRSCDQPSFNAAEKLNCFYSQIGLWKTNNKELIMTAVRTLYNEKNLMLRMRLQQAAHEYILPFYTEIIEQGNEEGIFDTPYPKFSARIVLGMSYTLSDNMVKLILKMKENPNNKTVLISELEKFQWAIERMLACRKGLLELFDPKIISAFSEGGEND